MAAGANGKYYTTVEVEERLSALSETDMKRLELIADQWAVRVRGYEGRDLRSMLFVSMLEDRRHWPRDLPLEAFYRESMWSLTSTLREKEVRRDSHAVVHLMSELVKTNAETGDDMPLPEAVDTDDPVGLLEADELIDQIEKLLSDNDRAGMVFMGWQDGMSKGDIIATLGITETDYDTATKYILRRKNELLKKLN